MADNDKVATIMSERLATASSQANHPTGFFSNDPLSNYKVYLGPKMTQAQIQKEARIAGVPVTQDMGYSSYQDAVLAPLTWGPDWLKEFVNKGILNKVPGFEVGMGMPQIQAAWQDLVKASIMFNQNIGPNQTPWSPTDVLDTWSNQKGKFGTQRQGDWLYDVATGERIEYVGSKTKTSKSTQVNLSSPEEVQTLVTQTLREALGRAPTAKELAVFKSTISGYEEAHPQVTTVTQSLSDEDIQRAMSGGGDVWAQASEQSSTTTGGVSDAARQAVIMNPVEQSKEFAKYQGGTTYFNALLSMFGGS